MSPSLPPPSLMPPPPSSRSKHRFERGFTLTELAVAFVIISLLIGGLAIPLTAQMDIRDNADTQRVLAEAREALIGYALLHGYLPCPADFASAGVEQRNVVAGTCTATDAVLPWSTLGIQRSDTWGRLVRYRVLPKFADNTTPFSLSTTAVGPDLLIRTRDPAGATADITNSTTPGTVVAVLYSNGKNGAFGIVDESGKVLPGPNAGDEYENDRAIRGLVNIFYQRPLTTDANVTGGSFDDQLIWVPLNLLVNRMVTARKIAVP